MTSPTAIKKHFYFVEHSLSTPRVCYLCNWAVKPTKKKLSKQKRYVTCKNCLRILKNFPMRDTRKCRGDRIKHMERE